MHTYGKRFRVQMWSSVCEVHLGSMSKDQKRHVERDESRQLRSTGQKGDVCLDTQVKAFRRLEGDPRGRDLVPDR